MARRPKERGGGTLSRSETVTIRLDPRLNYLCELAARVQRRTKSSFIEAVIDGAMSSISLEPRGDPQHTLTLGDRADQLWHVRDYERLVALARLAPHLMTMQEQEIWALICEHGSFWRGRWVQEGDEEVWTWQCNPNDVAIDRVAEHWKEILGVVEGSADKDSLPAFSKRRALEIPF